MFKILLKLLKKKKTIIKSIKYLKFLIKKFKILYKFKWSVIKYRKFYKKFKKKNLNLQENFIGKKYKKN
jgi:hypothetical protein